MNWYSKTFLKTLKTSKVARETVEYTYNGVNFIGNIYGRYHHATHIDPAENPEAEIVGAEIEDPQEMMEIFYDADYDADNDVPVEKRISDHITEDVNLRVLHFGANEEPFMIKWNGLTLVINVPLRLQQAGTYITNWTVTNARIDNLNRFLGSLPGKITKRIQEGMLEDYVEGRAD